MVETLQKIAQIICYSWG